LNLKKKKGFWSSAALVTGNMIGLGIFLLPASLAIYGGISLTGWLFSALGALLFVLVFSNLGRFLPNTNGGPYAYTKAGLGGFPAYLVAWGYWISIWSTNAAIAVALVGYLAVFFPILTENPSAAIFTGLSFIWLFSWINSKDIKTVGLVLFERKEKNITRKLILAFLSFCFSIWIILGAGQDVVFWGFILLMSGIPFYVWLKRS
jgi:APA family basic amino acid/polyamine antiporter